jgi:hypothetical protein
MRTFECEFEEEVLAAVVQSRWPERVDAQLRGHVAACPVCSGVAAIAGAFDEAREETRTQAVVPDSGRVWWLAQLRARREAERAAARPITAVQVLAIGGAAGMLGACFGATSAWFQSALRWSVAGLSSLDVKACAAQAAALIAGHGVWILAAAAILLLVPAAVLVAITRE